MKPVLRLSVLSVVVLCLASPAATRAQTVDPAIAALNPGAPECARVESLSNLQRRIVEKAAPGPRSLIWFVHGTRMTYQLDLMHTVAWLEARNAALRACGIALAEATASH